MGGETREAPTTVAEPGPRGQNDLPDPTEDASEGRAAVVRRAVAHWRRQLIDTSGNNRLLSYRDMRAGTLNLTPRGEAGARPAGVDALLRGDPVELSSLFPAGAKYHDAHRRVSNISHKATIVQEEKGLDSLFVALGLARWRPADRRRPNAPVVLVPMAVERAGGGDEEFVLTRSGDPVLNPVLALVLRVEYGIRGLERLLQTHLTDLDLSVAGARELLGAVERVCGEIPGFTVAPRAVMGNFSYAAMPMVIDVEGNLDRLVTSELVSALAGDEAARRSLEASRIDVPVAELDRMDPRDEILVLDADSSQREAIERVIRGESLVIQGPPGTGKSQTIVNMIAALAAAGKRVLFVAEKRVAIESVRGRLEQLGLDELVLDLRGGVGARQRIAEVIGESLESAGAPVEDVPVPPDDRLGEVREHLRRHVEDLHRVVEPAGLSRYQIYERLIVEGDSGWTVPPMPAPLAESSTSVQVAALTQAVREWAEWGGPAFVEEYPEWHFLLDLPVPRIESLLTILDDLGARHLPDALATLRRTADEVKVEHPATLEGWGELLELFRQVAAFTERYDPAIYRENLEAIVLQLAPADGGALSRLKARVTSSRFRGAVQSVRGLSERDRRPDQLLRAATAAIEHKRQWVMRRKDGRLPRVPEGLVEAEQALAALQDRLEDLRPEIEIGQWMAGPLSEMEAGIGRIRRDPLIANVPRLATRGSELVAAGLQGVLEGLASGHIPLDRIDEAVSLAWLAGLLTAVRQGGHEPFDGTRHSRLQQEFRRLDRRHVEACRDRVLGATRLRAARALIRFPDQVDFLRAELAKDHGFVPARVLVDRAEDLIGTLRPCWMMSPLLVSEVLPNVRMFDVVIFDEASQVIPAEAVPSLARGRQMVIVGDRLQLPPTTFFTRTVMDEEVDDAADEPLHFESILDAASDVVSEILLDRHYRSRDERLISFSNAEIYSGALRTFPGPGGPSPIVHHVVPGPSASDGTRSNPHEVDRVVDLTLAQALERPDLSLGVIAMGQTHAHNIEQAIRRRLASIGSPELDDWFGARAVEPFFVKHLERVQGDERDVVILSAGYHKGSEGELSHAFGPLLQSGGERRLNVAITRSRVGLHVVTSFGVEDMVENRSPGVELLRRFLLSLEGHEPAPPVPEANLGPILTGIGGQLEGAGIPVEIGLGRSGYRVDIAARHPDDPDRFVLAVEIDGEAYRSEPTVRDRDRVMDESLERLGWRVHRIWVDDWMRDPKGEARRAVEAWVDAVMAADRQPLPGAPISQG